MATTTKLAAMAERSCLIAQLSRHEAAARTLRQRLAECEAELRGTPNEERQEMKGGAHVPQ